MGTQQAGRYTGLQRRDTEDAGRQRLGWQEEAGMHTGRQRRDTEKEEGLQQGEASQHRNGA